MANTTLSQISLLRAKMLLTLKNQTSAYSLTIETCNTAMEREFCLLLGNLNDNLEKNISMERNFHFSGKREILISDFAGLWAGRGEGHTLQSWVSFFVCP